MTTRAEPQVRLRVGYAADRDIGVAVLRSMIGDGVSPLALLLSSPERASHADELVDLCPDIRGERILRGGAFRDPEGIESLRSLELDYLICVHFPYIVPPDILAIPRIGVLNLHPALLPYNRGWHTASWAILEGTPYGATLHFMSDEVDAGDIVHQRALDVHPWDTADSLYRRVKTLELQVFEEAWPSLVERSPRRQPQDVSGGTFHKRQELLGSTIQEIDLDSRLSPRDLLDRLRALTTDRIEEAALVRDGAVAYRVQVRLTPQGSTAAGDGA